MTTEDAEIEAMQIILGQINRLYAVVQERVVRWVGGRFLRPAAEGFEQEASEQETVEIDRPATVEPVQDLGATARARTIGEYVGRLDPSTATEPLLFLLAWAEINGAGDVAVRDLDDMNREVGGSTFSDAGSISQAAIKNEYARAAAPRSPRPDRCGPAGRRVVVGAVAGQVNPPVRRGTMALFLLR